MEEKVEEKISFWKRILISIKDFEKYKIFAVEKLSKSFKYFFQFALLFVLIIALSFSVKYGMIINKTTNYIKNDFGYVINFDEHGSDNAFEFYSPTISKATGIQKVLDYYHLDQDDTYAFGDGENDLEMIEFCRVGVAMGNACDVLKEKANIVCKSIVDDGLEDILKILFSE